MINLEDIRYPYDWEALVRDLPPPKVVGQEYPVGGTRLLREEFIKGPIPRRWVVLAHAATGDTGLLVGMHLWFLAGLAKGKVFRWRPSLSRSMGVSSRTIRRTFLKLEAASLVQLNTQRGRAPIVTILDVDAPEVGPTQ